MDVEDKWCWLPDSSRGFTVKSCYMWLYSYFAGTSGQVENVPAQAYRRLWRNDVPSEALIFTWRLLLERIVTREALHRRGIFTTPRDLCCVVVCFVSMKPKHPHTFSTAAKSLRRHGNMFSLSWDQLTYCTTMW